MATMKSGPGGHPVRGATTPAKHAQAAAPKARPNPNRAFPPKSRGFKGKVSN